MEPTPEQDKLIEQAVQHLPREIRRQVREFIQTLLNQQGHPPFVKRESRETALRDPHEQYTTVHVEQEAPMADDPLDAILRRIDSVMLELRELRQAVLTQQHPPAQNLAAELYGSWGQGAWEEYQPDVEWQRFSDE